MATISTRPMSGGAVAVFCGRCRVGYITPRSHDDKYLWEFCFRSEALDSRPSGEAPSRQEAIGRIVVALRGWLAAAGLPVAHGDVFQIAEDER